MARSRPSTHYRGQSVELHLGEVKEQVPIERELVMRSANSSKTCLNQLESDRATQVLRVNVRATARPHASEDGRVFRQLGAIDQEARTQGAGRCRAIESSANSTEPTSVTTHTSMPNLHRTSSGTRRAASGPTPAPRWRIWCPRDGHPFGAGAARTPCRRRVQETWSCP